jgi:hypothetical protein
MVCSSLAIEVHALLRSATTALLKQKVIVHPVFYIFRNAYGVEMRKPLIPDGRPQCDYTPFLMIYSHYDVPFQKANVYHHSVATSLRGLGTGR